MIEQVLTLALPVARLIDRRDSTKYERELLSLKDKIYYEEHKKMDERDDGLIHDYSMRILRITSILGNTFEGKEAKNS